MTPREEPVVAIADLFGIRAGRDELLEALVEAEREATGQPGD